MIISLGDRTASIITLESNVQLDLDVNGYHTYLCFREETSRSRASGPENCLNNILFLFGTDTRNVVCGKVIFEPLYGQGSQYGQGSRSHFGDSSSQPCIRPPLEACNPP